MIGELAFGAAACRCPLLAVTGTNGKTTTTELTAGLLAALGLRVCAAGNIGDPVCAMAADSAGLDFLVLEVSSFQLELSSGFRPAAAAMLNLSSDHQDRYESFGQYAAAKAAVFGHPGTAAVVNLSLRDWWRANFGPRTAVFFSADGSPDAGIGGADGVVAIRGGDGRVTPVADLRGGALAARHNVENALAAVGLAAAVLGPAALGDPRVGEFLRAFKTGEHRIELFLEKGGVAYIDDSKATNPDSVVVALRAVAGRGNAVLILGGLDKDMDFSPLLAEAARVKRAFLIGRAAVAIEAAIGGVVATERCGTFEAAVSAAVSVAAPGDVVMLSPACASMDMFANYRERGRIFKRLVAAELAVEA
jgi:UDP-N-acetylmuramoylalanine--D-glutamate ligase